ncbi:hypothetical protein AAC387_Pa05g2414 [Persea americana]
MGSKLLPQALVLIPQTASPHHSKLGFSAVSSLPSSLSSTRIAVSSVNNSRFFPEIVPIITRWKKQSPVVRAEANPEEAVVDGDSEENTEENVESDTEASDVAKEKPPPRKPLVKLGDIMGILHKQAIEASQKERPTPDIRTGDIVEVKMEVPENKRRLSVYKGIVMSKQNAGIHTTIRIRRMVAGIGVEIVFPVYSPNIKEIKVVGHRKVRRARLYYLRDKLPRFSTFK